MRFGYLAIILIASTSLGCLAIESNQDDAAGAEESHKPNLADLIFGGSRMLNYLLIDAADSRLNVSDPIDATILDLLSNNGLESVEASVEVVERAWELMHKHAEVVISKWLEDAWPIIDQSLKIANVSQQCHEAAFRTLTAASRLDRWAIQMMTSWGSFPPSGLYDGTTGDPGSYIDCVTSPENPIIGHAHYCSIVYQPVVPDAHYYDLIVRKKPQILHYMLNHISRDPNKPVFPNQSHNFHDDALGEWLYEVLPMRKIELEWGTCFPIQCSPLDVQKMAKLLANQAAIVTNSVSCSSIFEDDYTVDPVLDGNRSVTLQISIDEDLNDGVYIWKPHTTLAQEISFVVIGVVTAVVIFFTLVDIFLIKLPEVYRNSCDSNDEGTVPKVLDGSEKSPAGSKKPCDKNPLSDHLSRPNEIRQIIESSRKGEKPLLISLAEDCSIINNFKQIFRVRDEEKLLDGQISCINGIRCITCIVIVCRSTLIRMKHVPYMFFAPNIPVDFGTLVAQFFLGANWVDAFFLVSGIINAFTVTKRSIAETIAGDTSSWSFSYCNHVIKRYLRLVPISLLITPFYIILPTLTYTGGSHWYQYVGQNSERCSNGWWTHFIFIQSMCNSRCNTVSWYLSLDMLYYLIALVVIFLQLNFGHKAVLMSCSFLVVLIEFFNVNNHYHSGLPAYPLAIKPELPMDLAFQHEVKPASHGIPYFLGYYIGFVLANYHNDISIWLTNRRAFLGWLLTMCLIFIHSYGIHYWTSGEDLEPTLATLVYAARQIIWSLCIVWTIISCKCDQGSWVNEFLSCDLFTIIARASYVIFLTHYLIVDASLGHLEMADWQTQPLLLYILISIIIGTITFGILFCIVYEKPYLKLQKKLMTSFNRWILY